MALLKKLLALLFTLFAIAIALIVIWFYSALFPASVNPEHWRKAVEPYLTIKTREEQIAQPVVFIMHGCGGQIEWLRDERLNHLANAGFYTMAVNSLGPRDVSAERVCSGRELWGGERLLDIEAAFAVAQEDPRADVSNYAILGFSHGGWAALETYAGNWHQERSIIQPKAIVAYYPFCEFPNRASYDWQGRWPLLSFIASNDTVTAPQPCLDLFAEQKAQQVIEVIFYENAKHGFDVKDTQEWPNHFDAEYAEDSWQHTIRFLQEKLLPERQKT